MIKIPLKQWTYGKACLPKRFINPLYRDIPDDNWEAWISMEEFAPLYQANNLSWLSLNDSIAQTEEYLRQADELIYGGLYEGTLDGEEYHNFGGTARL